MTASRKRPILVIGRSGQMARALEQAALRRGIDLVAVGRPEVDLTLPATLDEAFKRYAPRLVINTAAYTAVDRAEIEPEAARAINGKAPGRIAERAATARIPLFHLSTDYVYDGRKTSPYVEEDPADPLSVYGRTKLEGDQAVLAVPGVEALIFRTAWVYSPFASNFVLTMLRLAAERKSVRVVADQLGTPTAAGDIAKALLDMAGEIDDQASADRSGVYHLAGTGETSWAGFAEKIFGEARRLGLPHAEVEHIATTDYPTLAARPANSRLDTRKLSQSWGVKLPDWRESLARCLRDIALDRRSGAQPTGRE